MKLLVEKKNCRITSPCCRSLGQVAPSCCNPPRSVRRCWPTWAMDRDVFPLDRGRVLVPNGLICSSPYRLQELLPEATVQTTVTETPPGSHRTTAITQPYRLLELHPEATEQTSAMELHPEATNRRNYTLQMRPPAPCNNTIRRA